MWYKPHPELNQKNISDNRLHITINEDIFDKLVTLLITTQKIQMSKQIYKLRIPLDSRIIQKLQSMIVITRKLHE